MTVCKYMNVLHCICNLHLRISYYLHFVFIVTTLLMLWHVYEIWIIKTLQMLTAMSDLFPEKKLCLLCPE